MRTTLNSTIASVVAFCLAVSPLNISFAQQLPDLGDESASVLSAAQERKLGETAYRELRAQGVILNDPEVNAYLNKLGQRLATANLDLKQSYEFFAVNDPAINAFAMPGGYIGVNIGLLALAQTESELASVLAHEMAHVSQHHIARALSGQARSQWVSLAALAMAILLARTQPQASQAALASAQAFNIQSQLDYTRDHEKEADRIGLNILEKSKLDMSAMASFFERLQRATRINENSQVPGYLRSHPITSERIADAQTRVSQSAYKQTVDSDDFYYVRALVRSYIGDTQDIIRSFEESLSNQKFSGPKSAMHYGLAASFVRDKQYGKASSLIDDIERAGTKHPMVAAMAAYIPLQAGDFETALKRYATALTNYPDHKQLYHDYPDALIKHKQSAAAALFMEKALTRYPDDPNLFETAARANADINKKLQSHRYLGESYWLSGNLKGAVEQFMIAAKAADGDFYQTSVVDARLRAARLAYEEQRKNQSGWGR